MYEKENSLFAIHAEFVTSPGVRNRPEYLERGRIDLQKF